MHAASYLLSKLFSNFWDTLPFYPSNFRKNCWLSKENKVLMFNQNLWGYEMFQNYRQELRDRFRNVKQNII